MLKFIRGKGYHPSAERLRMQKELFNIEKCAYHGFPNKPSALAWDSKLRLLAIGTRSGALRVYGAPGVEFYGQHENEEVPVIQLFFLPNQGRLISLCEDNSLHLWEINYRDGKSVMDQVKSHSLEGKLKKISKCGLETSAEHLLIGTEGGNIYLLDVAKFEMTETIIYQDVVMQNVPEDYKVNPGAVESITQHPTKPDKILIGYNRGLIVLWDRKTLNADQTYVTNQSLESIYWDSTGDRFMSSHNDGSYVVWSSSDVKTLAEPSAPYGPFPCKGISKALWCPDAEAGDLIVFGGGMPRASYGDRFTVTVMRKKKEGDEKHVVFDFTSKIVDFLTISDNEDCGPQSLVVLAEEELVVVDLLSDDLCCHPLPYLASLHASAITCSQYVPSVISDVWERLTKLRGDESTVHPWPVDGGVVEGEESTSLACRDVLLTGHEDGTVRFWDAGRLTLQPLYKLTTGPLFTGEDMGGEAAADEDEWPPFRKVGVFDPYSDDPRLAVKKLLMCPMSGTLVVAGTAGQVLVMDLVDDDVEKTMEGTEVNLVTDRDNFVWKGHSKLPLNTEPVKLAKGYQPVSVMQLHPPAAVTGLALQAEWGLIATGTGHGFSLYDYIQNKPVMIKCTLNPNDPTGSGDTSMSRRKSFKKSLRESFRRLRKGRSQRRHRSQPHTSPVKEEKKPVESPDENKEEAQKDPEAKPNRAETKTEEKTTAGGDEKKEESKPDKKAADDKEEKKEEEPKPDKAEGSAAAAPSSPEPATAESDVKPVERAIEARPVDDAMGSMVRCLYLAKSFIINGQTLTPTLWAGTNSGAIYVFTLSIPEKRREVAVTCQLGKEIQLKHRAPVIDITIIDGQQRPLEAAVPAPVATTTSTDTPASPSATAHPTSTMHRVVICSEEQFKVFSLPTLKPYGKFKLTAHEGSRVRRIGYGSFTARNNREYSETCLMCLTNQGDIGVYTVPELRRQIVGNCTKKEDINGILSLVYTGTGEAIYLHSPSEYQRVSMSASHVTTPRCRLELAEGMRPEPEPEKEELVIAEEQQQQEAEPGKVTEKKGGEPTENKHENNMKGGGDMKNSDKGEKEEPKENGVDEDKLEFQDLSNADITVDSVKDHLILSSEESKLTELKSHSETHSEVISTKIEEHQVKVVKTTLITTSNEVVRPIDDDPCAENGTATPQKLFENNHMRAPLATVEETDDVEL